jgi:hypothetical protein
MSNDDVVASIHLRLQQHVEVLRGLVDTSNLQSLAADLALACSPSEDPGSSTLHVVRIQGDEILGSPDFTNAVSSKLSNLKIDVRKLFDVIATNTISLVSACVIPWLLPFALFLLWRSVNSSVNIEINEIDACVLWVMWMHVDENRTVLDSVNVLNTVNQQMGVRSRSAVDRAALSESLLRLEADGMIKRLSDNNGWRVTEEIVVACP